MAKKMPWGKRHPHSFWREERVNHINFQLLFMAFKTNVAKNWCSAFVKRVTLWNANNMHLDVNVLCNSCSNYQLCIDYSRCKIILGLSQLNSYGGGKGTPKNLKKVLNTIPVTVDCIYYTSSTLYHTTYCTREKIFPYPPPYRNLNGLALTPRSKDPIQK